MTQNIVSKLLIALIPAFIGAAATYVATAHPQHYKQFCSEGN